MGAFHLGIAKRNAPRVSDAIPFKRALSGAVMNMGAFDTATAQRNTPTALDATLMQPIQKTIFFSKPMRSQSNTDLDKESHPTPIRNDPRP